MEDDLENNKLYKTTAFSTLTLNVNQNLNPWARHKNLEETTYALIALGVNYLVILSYNFKVNVETSVISIHSASEDFLITDAPNHVVDCYIWL